LNALPGGAELLAAAPVESFLVGGAVRDMLLGHQPRELDVTVVEEPGAPLGQAAAKLAGELVSRLGGEGAATRAPDATPSERGMTADEAVGDEAMAGEDMAAASEHGRFGTATVRWPGGRIDVATARGERYSEPGALPEVQPASLAEDLLRRDFTVNA